MISGLIHRLRYRYHRHVGGWASVRHGDLSRLIRWPLPGMAPYHWKRVALARMAGIGDLLMCTPALREMKRLNPACRITLYTACPDVLRGLSLVDEILPFDQRPNDAIELTYEKSLPPRRHIACIFGDAVGVNVRDVYPSCPVDRDRLERWRLRLAGRPRPVLVVNRRASGFTPNKDWPEPYWQELLRHLCNRGTVVEVGLGGPNVEPFGHANYEDWRGRTLWSDLVALMAASELHVGPVSAPVHVAAAVGVPTVVLYGGYEDPVCSGYTANINLFTHLPCSPCWLNSPCPHDRRCLRELTPDRVLRAVDALWRRPPVRTGVPS